MFGTKLNSIIVSSNRPSTQGALLGYSVKRQVVVVLLWVSLSLGALLFLLISSFMDYLGKGYSVGQLVVLE